eukprot:CAMPEP_0180150226 /NCGR_PEP_ID=MMETSP0986-20121125/21324_1 /TAXON_ID=697907 /ORGANISM="non described non described, Strain CCMP2293" /LENGTH=53 /DNA_ID=CAMNT_0022097123 /DNA_START=135 /DNA_END=296 /DNA_ORIENTATION=+
MAWLEYLVVRDRSLVLPLKMVLSLFLRPKVMVNALSLWAASKDLRPVNILRGM